MWIISYICTNNQDLMKFYIYIVLFLSLFTFSCKKKDNNHKVMFEITFLQTPSTGSSNMIEVYADPCYSDKKPNINRLNIPQKWNYEYIGLEKGKKVSFLVSGQLSYYYEMRVYIDGNEVSYRKVKVSDNTYYDDHVEASSGRNDKASEDTGIIEFTY